MTGRTPRKPAKSQTALDACYADLRTPLVAEERILVGPFKRAMDAVDGSPFDQRVADQFAAVAAALRPLDVAIQAVRCAPAAGQMLEVVQGASAALVEGAALFYAGGATGDAALLVRARERVHDFLAAINAASEIAERASMPAVEQPTADRYRD